MARSNAGVVLFATLFGVVAIGSGTGLLRVPDSWRVNTPAVENASVAPAETEDEQLKSLSEASNPAPADGGAISPESEAGVAENAGEPASEAQVATPVDQKPVPDFGNLRVLPSGEALIAGTAAPNSIVEAYAGSRKLGSAKALGNGDFVITFDKNLEPGDYEIVLRADSPDGTSATSTQTAIVSIPEEGKGELLALVEEPGEPSRLISTGEGAAEPMQPVEPEQLTAALSDAPKERPAANSETADPAPVAEEVTSEKPAKGEEVATVQPAEEASPVAADASDGQARIEAVEIDGSTVFVAGAGTPGARLRIYANDILLGETSVSPGGRFLIEIDRELPVGDYMVRADTIDSKTGDVLARAAVPFTRPDAERFAAVAPAPKLPDTAPTIPAPDADGGDAATVSAGGTVGATNDAPAAETAKAAETSGADEPVETANAAPQMTPAPIPGIESNVLSAPPLIPTDGSVIIRRGDTLWQISRRVYGRGVRYTTIYTANVDQIRDPDRIWPGQIFTVPEKASEDDLEAMERHKALQGG